MRWAIAIVPFVLLAGVGCGSDGSTETVTATTETAQSVGTKTEYVAAADSICKKFSAEIDELREQINAALGGDGSVQPAELPSVAVVMANWADAAEAQAKQLEALPQPSGDQAARTRFISLAGQYMAVNQAAADAAENGDLAGFVRLTRQAGDAYEKFSAVSVGFGFKVCGQD